MDSIPILEASMGDISSQIPVIGFFIIYIAVMFIHAITRFNLLALFLGFASLFLSVMMFSTNTIFAILVALLGVLYFYFFVSTAHKNLRR